MKLTDVVPNLIVADIDRSTAFYRDVLGFAVVTTVPEQAPYAFVWLQRDVVSVFLNARAGAFEDLPHLAATPLGGTATLYITIDAESAVGGVDGFHDAIADRCSVVQPLRTQFYGMREFAVEDPDGYTLMFAQRVS
jgi:catechol 2,3-dioxygenase-like lactoylglutathione lyase family enzyme